MTKEFFFINIYNVYEIKILTIRVKTHKWIKSRIRIILKQRRLEARVR